MKNLVKSISLIALLSFAITSGSCTTYKGGELKEENRQVDNFSGISLAVPATVLLTQGDKYSLTIEADEYTLERIETEVKDGTLRIKTQNGFSFGFRDSKIKIQITMPQVSDLSVSGSGNITAATPIKTDNLSTSISGSGKINIENLLVNSLKASISGSGNLNLSGKGTATSAKASVSGSGGVSLSGIEFADANFSISGSGKVKIIATENLKARVSGSGSIAYSGNPLIDAKVSGSGKIRNN